jgi:hypothetical protein
MGISSKILKRLLVIFICLFTTDFAFADSNANASRNKVYENLIKSFDLRSRAETKYLDDLSSNMRGQISHILTLIYAYSELKSGNKLSRFTEDNLGQTQEDLLEQVKKGMEEFIRTSKNPYIGTDSASKIIYAATQTLSEFAPHINIRDKILRDILVTGFTNSMNGLGYVNNSDPHNNYLREAVLSTKRMNTALTPPNIILQMVSKLKPVFSRPPVQNETGVSCHLMFF